MKYLLFIFMFLTSCRHASSYIFSERLRTVLELAGDNRSELEAVINHYSKNAEDSLKLKAAIFLIENMEGKYALCSNSKWEDVASSLYRSKYHNNHNSSEEVHSIDKFKKIYDIDVITASFLIENIELAFVSWRKYPWGKTIDFNTFKEEILPYRVSHEPLEGWRRKVLADFQDYDSLFLMPPYLSAIEACGVLNSQLPRFTWVGYDVPCMNYSMLISTPRGTCNEMVDLAMFVCRAFSIPVTRHFTPYWPNRHVGHSWNAVRDSLGRFISFMGCEFNPGESHLGTTNRKCKVYCESFSNTTNGSLDELQSYYMGRNAYDVSYSYDNTMYSVRAPIKIRCPSYVSDSTLWLMSFGKYSQEIIGRADSIGTQDVLFRYVGRDCLYLPVYYENGCSYSAGCPFYVDKHGIFRVLDANMCSTVEAVVDGMGLNNSWLYRLQQGTFEGANLPDFSDKEVLFRITEMPSEDWQVHRSVSLNKYRYVRYLSPAGGYGNIAEIEFYDEKGTPLKGDVIGSDFKPFYATSTKDKVFDGDVRTFLYYDIFDADYSWVGLDLKSRRFVDIIRYYPRKVDNSISEGHVYEIYVRDVDDWRVINRCVANDDVLRVKLPKDGLFYLRDATKDIESDSFFIIDSGRIKWI